MAAGLDQRGWGRGGGMGYVINLARHEFTAF